MAVLSSNEGGDRHFRHRIPTDPGPARLFPWRRASASPSVRQQPVTSLPKLLIMTLRLLDPRVLLLNHAPLNLQLVK